MKLVIIVDAYLKTKEEIFQEYETSVDGLKSTDVRKRQRRYGKNILIEKNKKTKVQIFLISLRML